MAVIPAQRFSVRSSLQEPSDQWEADIAGADEYQNTSTARRVDLEAGFEDSSGTAHTFRVLREGIIDEWTLQSRHDGAGGVKVISTLKGRDAVALLIDGEFRKRYLRHPAKENVLGESDVETTIGIFRARTIAEEIAAAFGLTLVWQARDYELWEDFDAVGRPLDLIGQLVQPWNSVEPSRVDIFAEGTTVYVRQRVAFPTAVDYSYEVKREAAGPHVRATGVTIRRSRLPIIGRLELQGRAEPGTTPRSFEPREGEQGVSSVNVEVIPLSTEIDAITGQKRITPGEVTQLNTSRSFGLDGRVVARVEERITYQMPNQVPLRTVRDTFSLVDLVERQVKREVKTTEYQAFTYDDKGPTNSPLPLREFAAVYRFVDETLANGLTVTVFKQDTEETTTHAYDEDGYLRTSSTVTRQDQDGTLVPTSMVVKQYSPLGPLMYGLQTDRYTFQEEEHAEVTGLAEDGSVDIANVTRLVPFLVQSDFAVIAGHRPGGFNRPPTKPINSELVGVITVPILSRPTVAATSDAVSAAGGSPHMSAADLAFIEQQYRDASGAWECELEFTALSMPWLRRGTLITLTGLEGEAGQSIHVGNALIYSVVLDHDGEGNRSVSTIRAVWWEPAPEA